MKLLIVLVLITSLAYLLISKKIKMEDLYRKESMIALVGLLGLAFLYSRRNKEGYEASESKLVNDLHEFNRESNMNLNNEDTESNYTLVLFSADWCGHTKKFFTNLEKNN